MTLNVQKHEPGNGSPAYWRAWSTDVIPGTRSTGRTMAEAIGVLVEEMAEREAGGVDLNLMPTAKGGA